MFGDRHQESQLGWLHKVYRLIESSRPIHADSLTNEENLEPKHWILPPVLPEELCSACASIAEKPGCMTEQLGDDYAMQLGICNVTDAYETRLSFFRQLFQAQCLFVQAKCRSVQLRADETEPRETYSHS